jgi:hypothetical protein
MRCYKLFTNVFAYLLLPTFCAYCQANTNSWSKIDWSKMNAKERYHALRYTTVAYQKEALSLIVEEANRVAQDLQLPEELPIVQTNLLEAYISPPRLAQGSKALGNITTSNYTYYISVGDKFSFLVRTHLDEDESQARSQYRLPISQMDTNAAYLLATQFLKAASMDVDALNTNCDLQVKASLPEGINGRSFVPLYWICALAPRGASRLIAPNTTPNQSFFASCILSYCRPCFSFRLCYWFFEAGRKRLCLLS